MPLKISSDGCLLCIADSLSPVFVAHSEMEYILSGPENTQTHKPELQSGFILLIQMPLTNWTYQNALWLKSCASQVVTKMLPLPWHICTKVVSYM